MPDGGGAALHLDMADIEAAGHIARQRIVPEHGHALEDGMAVAGQLALGEHRGAGGFGRQNSPGGTHVIDPLDQQVALGIHHCHGLAPLPTSLLHNAAVPSETNHPQIVPSPPPKSSRARPELWLSVNAIAVTRPNEPA